MTNEQIVMYAAAVILVCVLYVARKLLVHFGKVSLASQYDQYLPYAITAAKWVEETVPDDFGAGADDPKVEKMAHKLDLFLKKFAEIYAKVEKKDPGPELIAEAKAWSVELAERMNAEKTAVMMGAPVGIDS